MDKKYGNAAQKEVKKAQEERKEGKLKSGQSGKKVTSQKRCSNRPVESPQKRRQGAKSERLTRQLFRKVHAKSDMVEPHDLRIKDTRAYSECFKSNIKYCQELFNGPFQ